MRAFAALLLVACTACSNTQVRYVSTASSSAGNTAGAVYAQGGRPLSFLILTSLLIATAVDPQSASFVGIADSTGARPAPEMNPDRAINEQDCSKPIDLSAGNLRCR